MNQLLVIQLISIVNCFTLAISRSLLMVLFDLKKDIFLITLTYMFVVIFSKKEKNKKSNNNSNNLLTFCTV